MRPGASGRPERPAAPGGRRTSAPGLIALLTDFGLRDPFVGVMKGVILGIAPRSRIIDLCHGVPPQGVRSAALGLMASVPYLPMGTIVAVVVDPGVGTARRILWARGRGHGFLFPDNGVASWAERVEPFLEVREVSNRRLFLPEVSATFHGRDIFAPVAARLSLGLPPSRLGPLTRRWEGLPFPSPQARRSGLAGEVLAADRFGNAVTNLRADEVGAKAVFFRGRRVGPLRPSYGAVPKGSALAVAGSSGFVELSVREGDFVRRFKAVPGDRVEVRHP